MANKLRQETAAYTSHISRLLLRHVMHLPSELRILDLCTGSGCISLLLAYCFSRPNNDKPTLDILGVDISSKAIALAQANRQDQCRTFPQTQTQQVAFVQADILGDESCSETTTLLELLRTRKTMNWDVIISNPPYISPWHFAHTTSQSVRNFEPKRALVPPIENDHLSDDQKADLFYPRLLFLAQKLRSKLLIMEVGDDDQSIRIARLASRHGRCKDVRIWRDAPGAQEPSEATDEGITIQGRGSMRSVICTWGSGGTWLGHESELRNA